MLQSMGWQRVGPLEDVIEFQAAGKFHTHSPIDMLEYYPAGASPRPTAGHLFRSRHASRMDRRSTPAIQTPSQKQHGVQAARNFGADQGLKPQEYFVYFKASKTQVWGKRTAALPSGCFKTASQIKRERGESDIHPALAPVFACERYTAVSFTRVFAD